MFKFISKDKLHISNITNQQKQKQSTSNIIIQHQTTPKKLNRNTKNSQQINTTQQH